MINNCHFKQKSWAFLSRVVIDGFRVQGLTVLLIYLPVYL